MGLKRSITKFDGGGLGVSQSHHSGIETATLLNVVAFSRGRNRTIVGLKLMWRRWLLSIAAASQSHHSGIETKAFSRRLVEAIKGRNRTIVGLKRDWVAHYVATLARRNRTIVGLKRGDVVSGR